MGDPDPDLTRADAVADSLWRLIADEDEGVRRFVIARAVNVWLAGFPVEYRDGEIARFLRDVELASKRRARAQGERDARQR